jgi:DNA transposition AAA+ family ATPase
LERLSGPVSGLNTLAEAEKMGRLETILGEAGYKKTKATLQVPKSISVQRVSLPVPLTHV